MGKAASGGILDRFARKDRAIAMHIQVVTLPGEKFRPQFFMSRLVECWTAQGHRVTVGPCPRLDADLGIMHVDRTWVPPECIPENPHGRPLLNASVLDISKRRISRQQVRPDCAYFGPVIIKTDANCFGARERRGMSKWNIGRIRRRLARLLSWQIARELPPGDYPVLDHPGLVPDWVWRRDDLVVERFLPERDGNEYALRIWMFFGDREYGARLFGTGPVVKASAITHHEYIDDVPPSLRSLRRELGMDFGKFDYVVVDGEAVLLDVNKTPTIASARSPSTRIPEMAKGLGVFVDGVAP